MALSTVSAGNRLTAATVNTWINQINSLTAPGWTDYASSAPSGGSQFTLTMSTSNPTKGNSTYSAWYRRPASADKVDVRIRIVIGSTWVNGTGNIRLGLPFTASANASNATVGDWWMNDTTVNLRAGWITLDGITTYATLWQPSAASVVTVTTATSPGTWSNGDVIIANFSYEPA